VLLVCSVMLLGELVLYLFAPQSIPCALYENFLE
jgi:hypothetical protein